MATLPNQRARRAKVRVRATGASGQGEVERKKIPEKPDKPKVHIGRKTNVLGTDRKQSS